MSEGWRWQHWTTNINRNPSPDGHVCPQVGTPLAFFLVYTLTFALMTPLGIGIGLAVTELAADADHKGYVAATGTLQGDCRNECMHRLTE